MRKIFTLIAAACIVNLLFGQAQRTVLFEEFTGENCPPCAFENTYIDAFAGQYTGEVILIKYLAPIPTPGILSNQVSTPVGGRMDFYGVNSTPWGQQDGWMWDSSIISNWGNLPLTWCTNAVQNPSVIELDPTILNAEYAVASPFNISVTDTFTSTADSFYATVSITAAQAFNSGGSLKLQMVMVENLQFATPPGNNGETSWGNAVRALYPNYIGTTIPASWTNGQTETYSFKGLFPSYIRDKTQVRFVAFVQDISNKFVEQTAISNYFTFNLDLAATGIQGTFGNCNNTQYTPVIGLSNAGTESILGCYISEYLDGTFIDSVLWSGNLPAGNSENVTLAPLAISTGVHTLTLTCTGPNSTPDPNPGNNTVSLTLDIGVPEVTTPLDEGFENGDPVTNDGWAIENPDHDSTWRVVSVGHNSAHSYMCDLVEDWLNDFVNVTNNLYAPPLDLTYAAHATVRFDYAQQLLDFVDDGYYGGDSLYIDASYDCGLTWTNVYANGFTGMVTASAQSVTNSVSTFVPTNTEWATDSADLSAVANHPNVLLRFRPVVFDGNDFYLDNINIYKYDSVPYTPPSAIFNPGDVQSVTVYPNPANEQININLQLTNSATISCRMTDIAGNTVWLMPDGQKDAGQNIFSINTSALAEGVYFVTLTSGTGQVSKMVSVIR